MTFGRCLHMQAGNFAPLPPPNAPSVFIFCFLSSILMVMQHFFRSIFPSDSRKGLRKAICEPRRAPERPDSHNHLGTLWKMRIHGCSQNELACYGTQYVTHVHEHIPLKPMCCGWLLRLFLRLCSAFQGPLLWQHMMTISSGRLLNGHETTYCIALH